MQLYGHQSLPKAIVWESETLYLTPAPGTIMLGYLILAPKRHVLNFTRLPRNVLIQAEAVVRAVQDVGAAHGLPEYLVFEHGASGLRSRGACCVDHAHLHLAPSRNPAGVREHLGRYFPECRLRGLRHLGKEAASEPYVMVSCRSDTMIYRTPIIPSQFVRQILAVESGVPNEWNWRYCRRQNEFWKTHALFAGRIALS